VTTKRPPENNRETKEAKIWRRSFQELKVRTRFRPSSREERAEWDAREAEKAWTPQTETAAARWRFATSAPNRAKPFAGAGDFRARASR
jgi:hypothetical protein